MKALFVGDIHGRLEIMEQVEREFPNHLKVFVGDFVDSFDRSRKQQLACVAKALKMIEKGDTQVVLGNHELSYLHRSQRCSGWAGVMDAHLLPIKSRIWRLFKPYLWFAEDKLLVTHAGLHSFFWEKHGLTVGTFADKLQEWEREPIETGEFYWIGKVRGGFDPVGGIFWCDWNDEFEPIPEIKQVLGHTGVVDSHHDLTNGIRNRMDKDFNIDCLSRTVEFLEYKDGVFTIVAGAT